MKKSTRYSILLLVYICFNCSQCILSYVANKAPDKQQYLTNVVGVIILNKSKEKITGLSEQIQKLENSLGFNRYYALQVLQLCYLGFILPFSLLHLPR